VFACGCHNRWTGTETLLATTGQIFMRLLELHGVDAVKFVREGGYDPALFRDPSARLPRRAVDRAVMAAAERIASGESPEAVAAKVPHMRWQTLQRKLADADLSYQQLVDDTR
jgi:hypothetical protein